MANSIIWEDSTTFHDERILKVLIEDIVVDGFGRREECLKKIIIKIQSPDWQIIFTHRHFVFSVLYIPRVELIEQKLGLATQAIDALYFLLTRDRLTTNLAKKISYVFKYVYGHPIPYKTANAVRVL